jgi:hypothetical protein
MKAFVLILSLALIVTPANAADKTVLLQAGNASAEDYAVALEANHIYSSFIDQWSNREETQSLRRELRRSFADAQQTFLQSAISDMKTQWEAVALFAPKEDWPKKYRQLIQTAHMRRAQLSTSNKETEKWLQTAIAFDPSYEPDRGMFPPPLVLSYNRLRSRVHRRLIRLSPISGFDILLVNGTEYNLNKVSKVFLPESTVRATYLSNRYAPVTRFVKTNDIERLQPERAPFALGTCATPELANAASLDRNASVALLFEKHCLVSAKTDSVDSGQPSLTASIHPEAASIETKFDSKASHSGETPLYKKPWFWVGAVAIAGGIIAASQPRGDSSSTPPPTHAEGFK